MTDVSELLDREIYCGITDKRHTLREMMKHFVESDEIPLDEVREKEEVLLSIIYDQDTQAELRSLCIQLLAEVQREYEPIYEFKCVERADFDIEEEISAVGTGVGGLGN